MNFTDHCDQALLSNKHAITRSLTHLLAKIAPCRRDLVSDGYDQALDLLAQEIPLTIKKFPSGTKCDTWTIPPKWTCRSAKLLSPSGRLIFSDQDTPLRVASYSSPFFGLVQREELLAHLHVHPTNPDAIPFKFFYYTRNWGLCCRASEKTALTLDKYQVEIDSEFSPGELKTAEFASAPTGPRLLLCAHLCHPAMANDDASGVVVGVEALKFLSKFSDLPFQIHLLLVPETIGTIAWLNHPETPLQEISAGIFLEMLGHNYPFSVQLTLNGQTELDAALIAETTNLNQNSWHAPFPGIILNDERQFNGPGFEIPMASLSRVLPMGHPGRPYPEYHTNLDTPERCNPDALFESLRAVIRTILSLSCCQIPKPNFRGEIFLQNTTFGSELLKNIQQRLDFLKVATRINGRSSLRQIAHLACLPEKTVRDFIQKLTADGLVTIQHLPARLP